VCIALLLAATLTARLDDLAKSSGGRAGVFVQVIETGETAGVNDAEHFPMQSVYKLPISMAVLDQVDQKKLTLNQKVSLTAADMAGVNFHSPLRDKYPRGGIDISIRDLIRAAIVDSDGIASDTLFKLGGGGSRLTSYLRGLGIRDIDIATSEREMFKDRTRMTQYRNFATPRAAAALLKALYEGRGVSPAARDILLQFMTESVPGPKRLKGLLPPGTAVAHKTGTDGTFDGLTRATNDIGIITLPNGRHLAIAVFVKDSKADEATREGTIAKMAKAAYDAWAAK
jgi:beta-lactamase class A